MSDEVMTEEEQEAWYAAKAERKLAHLNSLDQATKDLAIAVMRKVEKARQADRTIEKLGVTWEEFNAWERFLMPDERWMSIPLANAGHQNTFCKGIPIYPEDDDG